MKLVCLGAKNPHTIKIIKSICKSDKNFEFLGFIDNDKSKWGKKFYSYPIFGGIDKVKELTDKDAHFCNLITGDCITRYETTLSLVKNGGKLTNLIHPNVDLDMVRLGVGNYIQEYVDLQAEVSVGNNSSIHIGAYIGHETTIGNSVFVAHGCNISGCVSIEDGVYMGTGVTTLPRLSIGKWSIIGAGSVLIHDVPPYSVVVGNPAKIIRNVEKKYESGDIL